MPPAARFHRAVYRLVEEIPRGQVYEFVLNHVVHTRDAFELVRSKTIDLKTVDLKTVDLARTSRGAVNA